MEWMSKLNHLIEYIKTFFKWIFLGVFVGVIGGIVGSGFNYVLRFAAGLREDHQWLIFLLPVAGILTVLIYKLLRINKLQGTNEIIDATLDGHNVPFAVAPGIFISTALTHFFGGSAGREGAALQLGGTIASLLGKIFRLSKEDCRVMVMSGMSSVFAGLFGTPVTAALFCMEFESVGTIFSPALLPCFVSAFFANRVSLALGIHTEGMLLENILENNPQTLGKVALLAIALSLLGIVMCTFIHKAEYLAKRYIPNNYFRIVLGGVVILVMTLAVGDQRYNGSGMEMALKAVGGQADWYDFFMKLLFTAITLAVGFKGGEIVPTFCIGATFGCFIGSLLGIDSGICGALGLVGLFCCVTNSPLASIILSIEMFGSNNLHIFALVCAVCFVLSGNSGLYTKQIIQFHKTTFKDNYQNM